MKEIAILWVDDEIDLLKAHIVFLENKGYRVLTASNGIDAIKILGEHVFNLIFLDENMPGQSGLQTLVKLKQIQPHVPVIMITKSEEENIMDQAIGSKIADYLIKPVNPNQILLTIKKHTDNQRLVSEHVSSAYQTAFRDLTGLINKAYSHKDWVEIYKTLVFWELELERSGKEINDVLRLQKTEANSEFSKFVKKHYSSWFEQTNVEKPLLSAGVMKQTVAPLLQSGQKVLLIVIDNLRFDQWKSIAPMVSEYCYIEKEDVYFSILPTSTQYARNALFAGLMPLEIERMYPKLWVGEEDSEGKNLHEEELLRNQTSRLHKDLKVYYEKILNPKYARKVLDNFSNYKNNSLNVLVFNFVDALSHARTETEVVKELVNDESSYRSITQSWFQHSILPELLAESVKSGMKVILTTDHGTIKVNNPIKVIGDKATSPNIRYKHGRNLNYNPKEVFEIRKPSEVHLPSESVTSSFIFAYNSDFMVYPNNYNHFANFYRNTFQHGGISMEEMIIPLITLSSKQN